MRNLTHIFSFGGHENLKFAQFKMFPIEVFIAVDMLLIANYFQSILNIFELRNHLK